MSTWRLGRFQSPAASDTSPPGGTLPTPSRSTAAPAATVATGHKRIEGLREGVTIRVPGPSDRDAILTLVRQAFSSDSRDGQEEVDIVVNTWQLEATLHGLELVAVDGGSVIGHVLAARGDLGGRDIVAVAPLAVSPSRQGQGVGTALMTELLRRVETAGYPLVALLGNPAYYSRFGFEPSGPLSISYLPVGNGNPHFQVRRLSAFDPSYSGQFTYCWEAEHVEHETE